jgi:TRAP-type mannitol/chloroaromatic compound transport system permease large subunit
LPLIQAVLQERTLLNMYRNNNNYGKPSITMFLIEGISNEPIEVIYKGVILFLMADIIHVAILLFVPAVVLFLPSIMG